VRAATVSAKAAATAYSAFDSPAACDRSDDASIMFISRNSPSITSGTACAATASPLHHASIVFANKNRIIVSRKYDLFENESHPDL
jgi:hypothetical protein